MTRYTSPQPPPARGGGDFAPSSHARCTWAESGDAAMLAYHDREWGVPHHDDRALFELLTLEGAQAGLSWRTILARRDEYRRAYHDFDIERVAKMRDAQLEKLLLTSGIIRNRLKVFSVRDNARVAREVMAEHGSLDAYLWSFIGGKPIVNKWRQAGQVPATTEVSDRMSKALRKRGFRFVGSTICYAFMQATGMVNDHLVGCFRYEESRHAEF
jgi:DNA-3-methyladenine glycosylase I